MARLNAMSIEARGFVIVGIRGIELTAPIWLASNQIQPRIMTERQATTRQAVEESVGVARRSRLVQSRPNGPT